MSVSIYDDALLRKLQRWTRGTNVTITGVNDTKRLFEVISDTTDDRPIQLPLIALSRDGGYTIINKQKRPISFSGDVAGKNQKRSRQLNAIPILINYQIDVYTRYLQECDEYMRNFIFNIINYPQLDIEIPYENSHIMHHANIRVSSEVQDNSSIPERLITGQFTRMSVGINIDDAYLWDVRTLVNPRVVEVAEVRDQKSADADVMVTNHLSLADRIPDVYR